MLLHPTTFETAIQMSHSLSSLNLCLLVFTPCLVNGLVKVWSVFYLFYGPYPQRKLGTSNSIGTFIKMDRNHRTLTKIMCGTRGECEASKTVSPTVAELLTHLAPLSARQRLTRMAVSCSLGSL